MWWQRLNKHLVWNKANQWRTILLFLRCVTSTFSCPYPVPSPSIPFQMGIMEFYLSWNVIFWNSCWNSRRAPCSTKIPRRWRRMSDTLSNRDKTHLDVHNVTAKISANDPRVSFKFSPPHTHQTLYSRGDRWVSREVHHLLCRIGFKQLASARN